MTKTPQKITLSPSRDIPFNKLVLSQSNVRRTKDGVSIEQLAESIAERTLLQSLNVRAVLDDEGQETGMFEVPAGGRRYRALELLVKQKRMAKTQAVPCVVRDSGLALDDSFAENDQRIGLHPLDQFRAFQALHDSGMSEEEIAARHFVTVAVVKQRLRLAAVSPVLLDVYAADGMTLEQLMAFTVTADHERQVEVWDKVSRSGCDAPYQIRRQLTERTVRAFDRRVQFVGLAAYEDAGGAVLRDLFEADDGGWLEDVALLDRLVAEKLQTEAERIGAEGWKWIAAAVDFPFGHSNGLRELQGEPAELTADEQETIEALRAEQAKLEADHSQADELPEDVDRRLGEIEEALQSFEERSMIFDAAEMARAGAFVSVDSEGRLRVARGFVRPEDEVAATSDQLGAEAGADADGCTGIPDAEVRATAPTIVLGGGQSEVPDQEGEDVERPLPERLISELSAYRTLALRDALGRQPQVAFQAVLHSFVLATFYPFGSALNCLEISLRSQSFPEQPPALQDSIPAKAIAARHAAWKAKLPASDKDLWTVLTAMDGTAQAELFAHCAAQAVNAISEPASRVHQGRLSAHGVRGRLEQADRLSRAVGLDMISAGWKPTVDNYLGRVTKHRILQTVREAKGEASVQLIEHLKKPDMAREAERLLDGSGWLPEPLRGAETDVAPAAEGEGGDGLPAFLSEDEEATEGADEVEEIIAAE
ncbi:putative plasmid stabilization protein [Bradyrhizobium sp. ORS 285]|uniref:ParB/RepB/Spo0J family partition protein n=1 Tax=Bradyrhizobium sp. ORS 285 TaxID=115808 RepID=UPI00024089A2|nr:ParB/RepB/Spo0J family partition protein [Bradyrhizobium sp. ORS 285]CCD86256.1 putative plasmid stabilization protein [Bradyrhizobium sp. ORS 285]SMX61247.1 putative plasmid stabilization protein [Bradyrhizobium sp. ORS 285]